ncbi:Hypothetical protein A7982_07659 [Minicystis rosea]|nr:Hypothetical protein A7982_07659 [Minicystis rosea]
MSLVRRRAGHALVIALALALGVALTRGRPRLDAPPLDPPPAPPRPPQAAAIAEEHAPKPAAAAPALPVVRADAKLDRAGRTAFAGGYLSLLPDFASEDGAYDLVVFFHGNTELCEQSLAYARIGAVFVTQNLGVGSGPYETRFADPGALPDVLARVQTAMERRGLAGARLGRLALVSWSAGYGAVLRILSQPALAERVDAVLMLDGIHIGRVPGRRAPAVDQIAPYERFARWAVSGSKLFTITHSDIAPDAYVGARDTTDVLLRRLDVLRAADGEEGAVPDIPAANGVLSKPFRVPLSPLTIAEKGQLRVRGYAGDQADHHILHLLEMGTIALPDLARWWARPREASP